MHVITKLSLMLLLCVSFAAFAESPNLSTLLNHIKTMRADFVQVIKDNHGKSVQTSYGRMALERPGKFRWQVDKPIPQVVIANDKRLWIYDPDLEQVTIKSLARGAGETPAMLLSHSNSSLASEFTIKQAGANDSPSFLLTPLKKDSMFAAIEMGFKGNEITQMKLKDHLGHTTIIQFKNIKTNTNLAASLFNFKARSGVDVIDDTKKR